MRRSSALILEQKKWNESDTFASTTADIFYLLVCTSAFFFSNMRNSSNVDQHVLVTFILYIWLFWLEITATPLLLKGVALSLFFFSCCFQKFEKMWSCNRKRSIDSNTSRTCEGGGGQKLNIYLLFKNAIWLSYSAAFDAGETNPHWHHADIICMDSDTLKLQCTDSV